MSAQALIGAVLNGRWRLTKLLGEGGMGAVYAAEGIPGREERAIKVLHHEFVHEPEVLRRFLAEAQTAQHLRHTNVAQVYESAQAEDGTPYLVMELLKGICLGEYVQPNVAIPLGQAGPVVYGVLQALVAAHAAGIIHRDLKPDNIVLVPDAAGRYIVKVLDFGIAKVMDAAGGMGSKTRTGIMLGTPGYMSPEQIRSSKSAGPRSDLWSVGVMFYEMITGRTAFEAPTEFAKLTAVLTQDPIPIASVAPHLAAWTDFFRRALARAPEDRFSSAQEMAEAIVNTARAHTGPGRLPTGEFCSVPPGRRSDSDVQTNRLEGAPPTRVAASLSTAGGSHLMAPPPAIAVMTAPTRIHHKDTTLKSSDIPALPSGSLMPAPVIGVRPVLAIAGAIACLITGFAAGFALAYLLFVARG